MGVFLSVADIIFAIIPRSDNSLSACKGCPAIAAVKMFLGGTFGAAIPARTAFPDAVHIGPGAVVSIHGPVHSYPPGFPGRILPAAPYLSDIHQHVIYPQTVQIRGNHVAAVALRHCVEIQLGQHQDICMGDSMVRAVILETLLLQPGPPQKSVPHRIFHFGLQPFHSAESQRMLNCAVIRELAVFESEPPDVIQRSCCTVQRPVGFEPKTVCVIVQFHEHCARTYRVSGVQPAQLRGLVVAGKGGVNLLKNGLYMALDIFRLHPAAFAVASLDSPYAFQIRLYAPCPALGIPAELDIVPSRRASK